MTILQLNNGRGAKSTLKCDNPECGKVFERLTSWAKYRARHYCCPECVHKTIHKRTVDRSAAELIYRKKKAKEFKKARAKDKVKKKCLNCGRIYEDYPEDLRWLKNPDKIYRGVCPTCRNSEEFYSEEGAAIARQY
jgi:hypothetical protein